MRELATYGPSIMLERIIDRISERTGKSSKDVLAEINKMHRDLNLLAVEVVALIYARENGVEIEDLIDDVKRKVLFLRFSSNSQQSQQP